MNLTNADLVDRLTALVHEAQEDRSQVLRALVGCDDAERTKHARKIRRLYEIDAAARELLFWMEHDQ